MTSSLLTALQIHHSTGRARVEDARIVYWFFYRLPRSSSLPASDGCNWLLYRSWHSVICYRLPLGMKSFCPKENGEMALSYDRRTCRKMTIFAQEKRRQQYEAAPVCPPLLPLLDFPTFATCRNAAENFLSRTSRRLPQFSLSPSSSEGNINKQTR